MSYDGGTQNFLTPESAELSMRTNFRHSLLLLLALTLLTNLGCYQAQPVVEPSDNPIREVANTEGVGSESVAEQSEESASREKIEKLFRKLNRENVGTRTTFDKIRLNVIGPKGATVNEQTAGFDDKEKGYSIRLNVVPMPFSREFRNEISGKFGENSGDSLYTRDIELDGKPGTYFFGAEIVPSDDGTEEPKTNLKHIISFGNEAYTWIVAASFPKPKESELSQMLLDSVMSTKIVGTDFPEVRGNEFGFSIIKPPALKFCKGWGEKYVLTSSGNFPVKSTEECFAKFEKRVSEKAIEKDNRLAYATSLLKATSSIAVNRVSIQTNIEVDGLPGYEVIGVGNEELSNTPVFLYSAVLFDDPNNNTYAFTSWYGMRDESMDQLDDLKTLMRSFRRTKK